LVSDIPVGDGEEIVNLFLQRKKYNIFINISGPEINLEAQTFDVHLIAGADYSDSHPQGGKNACEYPSNFVGGKK
jgi:hypothetical protein